MFAIRPFQFIDRVSLNLDTGIRHRSAQNRPSFETPVKSVLNADDIFTHVNLMALEGLGTESSEPIELAFSIAPVVHTFEGEANWRVVVDSRVTDRERSAIGHAARNVQRIFDMRPARHAGVRQGG
ncbi:hypothetical protein GN316_01170 [Xylophilus sp. Kf1]|nr:hypothetical protein [Xylophilus sp. Kf1]